MSFVTHYEVTDLILIPFLFIFHSIFRKLRTSSKASWKNSLYVLYSVWLVLHILPHSVL